MVVQSTFITPIVDTNNQQGGEGDGEECLFTYDRRRARMKGLWKDKEK